MEKTFLVANKTIGEISEFWTAREITATSEELSNIIPVGFGTISKLPVCGTYINSTKDLIITRLA